MVVRTLLLILLSSTAVLADVCSNAVALRHSGRTNRECRQLCAVRLDEPEGFAASCMLELIEVHGDAAAVTGPCYHQWVYGYEDSVATDFKAGEIRQHVKTPHECQQLCQEARDCANFLWRAAGRDDKTDVCVLKYEGAVMTAATIEFTGHLYPLPDDDPRDFFCPTEFDLDANADSPQREYAMCNNRKVCVYRSHQHVSGPAFCLNHEEETCAPQYFQRHSALVPGSLQGNCAASAASAPSQNIPGDAERYKNDQRLRMETIAHDYPVKKNKAAIDPKYLHRNEDDCHYVMELMHLQDTTHSYTDDLPNLRIKMPELLDIFDATWPGSLYGISTFRDKPIMPLGYDVDYCFRLESEIELEADGVLEALEHMRAEGGCDWQESSLDALLHAARSPEMGWSYRNHTEDGKPIIRVVMVITDAMQHDIGDAELYVPDHTWYPNNGDDVLGCNDEEYPSKPQLGDILREENVMPVFLVANDPRVPFFDIPDWYRGVLEDMGVPGVVHEMSCDSSDIIEAFMSAMSELQDLVCLTPTPPETTIVVTTPEPPTTTEGRTCLDVANLELALVHDASGSFADDIEMVQTKYPELMDLLDEELEGRTRYAYGSFVDKPFQPFGFDGDYCVRMDVGLTKDKDAIVEKLGEVRVRSGFDWWESSLDAIAEFIKNPDVDWSIATRTDEVLLRMIAISTDSGYHVAGDSLFPPFDVNASSSDCATTDYPSVADIGILMAAHDVKVMFLVTDYVRQAYVSLAAALSTFGGHAVVEHLEEDSSDIVESIMNGINDMCEVPAVRAEVQAARVVRSNR